MTYHSNNKQLGSSFEREFVDLLNKNGYWVHFITPNAQGSQPCDVIAVKNREAFLIDCKTSIKDTFPITRLENNQIFAFEKWRRNGNINTYIAVKYNERVYLVDYVKLSEEGKVKLTNELLFKE